MSAIVKSMGCTTPSLAEIARAIPSRLEALGIVVPNGSRFDVYQALFTKNSNSKDIISSNDFPKASQGFLDIQLMHFILDQLPLNDREEWINRLRKAIDDKATVVEQPTAHSPARDAQFELYVAAVLFKSGIFHCFDEKPDIHSQFNSRLWGVACKRLKSPQRLEQAIRAARKQILSSGLPGVIALDLSVALNQENKVIGPQLDQHTINKRLHAAMRGFMDTYIDSIHSWVNTTWVRGLILTYHSVMDEGEMGWILDSRTFSVPLSRENVRRREEFREYANIFTKGLSSNVMKMPKSNIFERHDATSYFQEARRKRWRPTDH